jgi:hypothetical protein
MAPKPVKGGPLRRALSELGCALSAGEAALLADQLLALIAEGLIVPAKLRAEDDAAPESES